MDPSEIGELLVCKECQRNGFASKGFEVYVKRLGGGMGTILMFVCTSCGGQDTMEFINEDYDG